MGAILTGLKWVVSNPLTAFLILVSAGMAFYSFTLMHENVGLQRDSAKMVVENSTLKVEKQALKESVDTLKTSIELTKQAQGELSNAIQRLASRDKATQDTLEKIDEAPPTDDAPLAPVLRNTLDRLRH